MCKTLAGSNYFVYSVLPAGGMYNMRMHLPTMLYILLLNLCCFIQCISCRHAAPSTPMTYQDCCNNSLLTIINGNENQDDGLYTLSFLAFVPCLPSDVESDIVQVEDCDIFIYPALQLAAETINNSWMEYKVKINLIEVGIGVWCKQYNIKLVSLFHWTRLLD